MAEIGLLATHVVASLIIECLIIQCCYWLEKTLTHCYRIWNRKLLSGWWFYAMLIFRLQACSRKPALLDQCFLHFFVCFFSLCCLQRYLKHYMHKVRLEFHSCSSFLSSSSSSSFFYSLKQRRLNLALRPQVKKRETQYYFSRITRHKERPLIEKKIRIFYLGVYSRIRWIELIDELFVKIKKGFVSRCAIFQSYLIPNTSYIDTPIDHEVCSKKRVWSLFALTI